MIFLDAIRWILSFILVLIIVYNWSKYILWSNYNDDYIRKLNIYIWSKIINYLFFNILLISISYFNGNVIHSFKSLTNSSSKITDDENSY